MPVNFIYVPDLFDSMNSFRHQFYSSSLSFSFSFSHSPIWAIRIKIIKRTYNPDYPKCLPNVYLSFKFAASPHPFILRLLCKSFKDKINWGSLGDERVETSREKIDQPYKRVMSCFHIYSSQTRYIKEQGKNQIKKQENKAPEGRQTFVQKPTKTLPENSCSRLGSKATSPCSFIFVVSCLLCMIDFLQYYPLREASVSE